MIVVKMVQKSKYSWEIVSPSGHMIQTDLTFGSIDKAEDYIKAYISSFLGWQYELVLL